ncbi:hypothetical protein HZY86_07550 [Aerococcaceae bacterium DSM 111020]|nr:hypothetical protein [Aerococcaceae bacterium DSM 111020]
MSPSQEKKEQAIPIYCFTNGEKTTDYTEQYRIAFVESLLTEKIQTQFPEFNISNDYQSQHFTVIFSPKDDKNTIEFLKTVNQANLNNQSFFQDLLHMITKDYNLLVKDPTMNLVVQQNPEDKFHSLVRVTQNDWDDKNLQLLQDRGKWVDTWAELNQELHQHNKKIVITNQKDLLTESFTPQLSLMVQPTEESYNNTTYNIFALKDHLYQAHLLAEKDFKKTMKKINKVLGYMPQSIETKFSKDNHPLYQWQNNDWILSNEVIDAQQYQENEIQRVDYFVKFINQQEIAVGISRTYTLADKTITMNYRESDVEFKAWLNSLGDRALIGGIAGLLNVPDKFASLLGAQVTNDNYVRILTDLKNEYEHRVQQILASLGADYHLDVQIVD